MRFTNECLRVCWLSGLLCIAANAWAQPATVYEAIEAAKKKRSQQAVATAEALPSALLPPINSQFLQPPSNPPMLWSIRGINGDYTAEIIYAQKIHPVKLETGAHFQEWEIVAFDSDSVSLVERKAKPKKSKTLAKNESSTKKPLKLLVAPTGNSIAPYRIQAGSEINTMQRQAAANLPASAPPAVRN